MQAQSQTIVAALTALAAVANGHITMKSPVPFGSVGPNKSLTTSPLTSANYPCQVGSNPTSFYSKDGIDNKMEIGKPQTISFEGSAVHGGGSCQLALTKDPMPSASTSWQVIMSIEGGCPSKTGTGVDEYEFTVPDAIAAGDYVFAWTWISKLSGTQEYYMNCAPVTITGGSGKRDVAHNETMELFHRDTELPELMVSNLGEINSCKSQLSSDPQYPNSGSNVMKPGSSNSFAPISGSNCVPKGAKDVGSGGSGSDFGSGSGSGSGSSSSSAPAQSATSSAASSQASSSAATPTSAASTTSTSSGFLTVTTAPTSSSEATSTSSSAVAVSSSSSPVYSAPSPSSSAPANGTSGVQGLKGPCSAEGMFNCIGGSSYQQCASGSWSVVTAMPPTTKCAEGQTMTLWGRDERAANAGKKKRAFQLRRWGY